MSKILILCSFISVWFLQLNCELYDDRPKIKTSNGDLIFEPAYGKNLYLRTNGPKSTIYIANIDITNMNISTDSPGYRPAAAPITNDITEQLNGSNGILRRIEMLESSFRTRVGAPYNLSALWRRQNRMNTQLTNIRTQIRDILTNKCSIRPCDNGGTCLNLAFGYHCLCTSNWEGKNCDIDVNECRNFAGTDLGCQNGATCVNKQGSYECLCRSGWYGLHCTRRAKDCSGGDYEMCGHGTCLPVTTGYGIKCICDQGWTTNGIGPACNTDINECETNQGPHCSVNPNVDCVNLPGSFRCGSCPPGYEGDGYVCSDIDECTTTPNGGCSTSPMVPCYNTIGSRICGSCPPGYQGDGIACAWRGTCSINRGGCHPSAQCIENPGLGGQVAMCMCPEGMEGDGVGLNGCYISTDGNSSLHCENNPCGPHGRCHPLPRAYTCFCDKGYGGAHCESSLDYCSNSPCRNGGTCKTDDTTVRGYRCECTAQYTGDLCQSTAKTCGGVLDAREGSIFYPFTNTTSYSHNSRCAWVIHTAPDKVINVTFTKFDIEYIQDCAYDFLQIHDGRSSASQLLGRFCGTDFPKGGNIISSHNNLYFWFRSDQTVAKDGFALHWTSINPVCGGEVDAASHGHITSPGWPGKYPPNRDCYWHLTTSLRKRIQLHFFQMDIEAHSNCSFDYLALYDGEHTTDPLLNKYCNSSQPAPLRSSGFEILVHFHSDSFGSGNGFQISFSPTEGIPGCDGLYTADKGEITSPSYNGTYLNNVLCQYEVRTAPNTKIRLNFQFFKLERSSRCQYDYLKIYDGLSSDAKLVGKFCGTTFPSTYISSSNIISLKFKSDRSIAADGFKITYETICQQTITGDSGVFNSPGYPREYPANRVCEYIISTIPGKAIQLTFQDFDIEDNNYYDCQYDNVEVRDGSDINSTLLGRFCGGSTHTPPVQTSTFNYMFVRFNSDLSISGTGFLANFTTIDIQCGGIYKSDTGLINHPSGSSVTYKDDQTCTWMLVAPPGYHIKLTWNRFDIEHSSSCENDYLELTEIDDSNESNELGKFCGSVSPPALTTSTNRLKLKFVSDSSLYSSGFSLSYSFLDLTTHCGGIYIKPRGVLYTPGWPKNYEPNRDCEWTITVPTGQQVTLNITTFDLEISIGGTCDHGDYLEVRNGATATSPLVGKFCGTTIPKRLTSMGNSLYIHFHSDYYLGGNGFKILWDGTITGCGGTLTGFTGSITSPNYPQPYHDNSECFYKIITNAGSRIRITFTDLDLERSWNCRDDYVKIYDGRDSSANSLGTYCSISANTHNIETSKNMAFIKFRSDILIGGKGFSLDYYTVCNNNVTGSYGVIESPNYPNKYPVSSNCLWTITVPKGNRINVTFTHFDIFKPTYSSWMPRRHSTSLRYFGTTYSDHIRTGLKINNCMTDYFQFRDGLKNPFNNKLCGSNVPERITTKNNVLQMQFISTYSSTGFRLEWVKDGCGGRFVNDFGTITLPNNKIKDELYCEWNIETTPGTAVKITFSDVYLMETQNCTTDAIEIYDGQDASSPLITKICHRGLSIYQTTSNLMLVKFVKQSDYRDVSIVGIFESVRAKCGGRLVSLSGSIYSPNYPNNYDNNLDCIWYLSVPVNHLIELNFFDFDLYDNSSPDDLLNNDCGDLIKIYDGNYIFGSNYTYKICPTTHPKQIISKSNSLVIQFLTDNSDTSKGFKANFSVVCGGRIIVKREGILTNDKLSTQQSNRSCVWTIIAEQTEQKISFTLTHMTIPKNSTVVTNRHCPSSYLKVLDGNDNQAPLIGEYCGRKVPPMLVSRGNSFTIELGSYTGITEGMFSAHYTTIDTACGGTLTSEEGSLASPNYPYSYPASASCEWILSTSPGNQVYLTFEEFNIEFSENCNEDYLEIRENNGAGRLIGVYCGDEVPTNTTVASKIFIKFHTDVKGTGPGFLAHYGFIHGSEIEGLENGEIASPLYPRAYGGPGEYTWRITSRANAITITIQRLEIVARGSYCYNSLNVFDGYDEDSPLLQEYCGLLGTDNKVIKSSSNAVYLKLKLDESNTGSLFYLQWSSNGKSSTEVSEDKVNCGNNHTTLISAGSHVEIKTPKYGLESYSRHLNCEWLYYTKPGSHLKLSFSKFEIEQSVTCLADYVSVYSSRTGGEDWKPIREHICTSDVGDIVAKNDNYMKIKFISDSSVSNVGFVGEVRADCGGMLTDPSGVVSLTWECWNGTNLAGPQEYEWVVKVRHSRTISLVIEVFNISSEYCSNYVKIHNGESIDSPMLGNGKYCGYSQEDHQQEMVTSSNSFYVSFHVSRLVTRGSIFQTFKIRYKELDIECGATSKLEDYHTWEIINSLNYPSVPIPYSECIWIFTGPPGEILRIDFIDRFDLEWDGECAKEAVEIRDGASETAPLKGRFCKEKPGTIKTTSNIVFIKYFTQLSEPRNGFKANVSIDVCGGTILASNGEISSPGYPYMQNFPLGTVCEWKIIGLSSHVFHITPIEVSMPESETYCGTKVTIEEIMSVNKTTDILKTYCETDSASSADTVDTFSNEVTFKLHIGQPSKLSQISNYKGFRFRYNSTVPSCGGSITAPEGFITTPGYPRDTNLRYCQWLLTAPNPSRRIRLEFLDSEFDREKHRIGMFNDHSFQSVIQNIPGNDWNSLDNVFESSGNKLAVYLWLAPLASQHRFKAKFTSNDLSLCGVDTLYQDTGVLVSPNLNRSYFCEWHYTSRPILNEAVDKYKTLYLNIKVNSSSSRTRCRFSDPKLSIRANFKRHLNFMRDICSNTERDIRIPGLDVNFKAIQGKGTSLYFHIDWKVQPCGGFIEVGERSVNILEFPINYNGSLDCAWVVYVPLGSRIEIQLQGSFSKDCSDEFLKINEGLIDRSSVIWDYCKDRMPPSTILTHFRTMYIQYHSSYFQNMSNLYLTAKTANSPCGGYLSNKYDDTFSSPNYPKRYSENQECSWEINTELGRRITLQFIERFVIEDKPNCTNDAVIIYDWKDDIFTEMGKVCGRQIPPNFNSTFNKMKVVFRTNGDINLDGFKAQWKTFCGGDLLAIDKEQFLYSPGYPNEYSALLDCTYHIYAPNAKTSIKFIDFELEGTYPACIYDNVTITGQNTYNSDYNVYCGKKTPDTTMRYDKVNIVFKTDRFMQKKGFKISYQLNVCDKVITEPSILTSGNDMNTYENSLNCTWSIHAPKNKVVIIKFSYIDLEDTLECYSDHLAVYEGLLIAPEKRIARICGHVNTTMVVRSTGNEMLVQFVTDFALSYTGFKAVVFFSYSQSVGCGGEIDLLTASSKTLKSPLINNNVVYEPFLDCFWIITAPSDKIVQVDFTSFHLSPCRNVNQTSLGYSNCQCDYVEVRDGINPNSLLIGKYCGHSLPPKLLSSGNLFSLRLYSDGEVESSGFEVKLSVLESECGQKSFHVNSSIQRLISPGYGSGNVHRGLHCSYYIHVSNMYVLLHIKIKHLDLLPGSAQNNECDKDRLLITNARTVDNQTFGSNFTLSLQRDSFLNQIYNYNYATEIKYPKIFTFCGVQNSVDLYTYGNLKLTFQTSPETVSTNHKGFEIEFTYSTWCTRNYTESNGRIQSVNAIISDRKTDEDCYSLITAPENYTISLYFFNVYPSFWNPEAYLEILDGDRADSPVLRRTTVTYEEDYPIFSTGRYILLHNHKSKDDSVVVDLNFVTTNKGRGCGGQLQNVIGIVTSPMYPDIYRKVSTCEWELETPIGTKLVMHFKFFDLGKFCDQNYVQLVDRNGKVFSTYCEEVPADYRSQDNYVKIVFKTTRNNGGQGWVAEFIATE